MSQRPTRSSRFEIRKWQQDWAGTAGFALDRDGYCITLRDNLFQPLSDGARKDFTEGDGAELKEEAERGKLQALHSSSALACNFFDYWRGSNAEPLERALTLEAPIREIKFEQKFPTGVGPRSPNLDVTLQLGDGSVVAIESKFLEPYTPSSGKNRVQEKYFSESKRRWSTVGLDGCQGLADQVHTGELKFKYLDVAQLLKHMLGLANSNLAGPKRWSLLYLWFDPEGDAAEQHESEIVLFERLIAADSSRFRQLRYSELLQRLKARAGKEHRPYLEYLRSRYFPRLNPV